MLYEEFDPPEHQSGRVLSYWHFATGGDCPAVFEHVVVPDGTVSIACIWLKQEQRLALSLVGPRRTALKLIVNRGAHYWGVRFRPGAFPFGGIGNLCDQVGPFQVYFPKVGDAVNLRLNVPPSTEKALSVIGDLVDRLLSDAPSLDAMIARTIRLIESKRGNIHVSELARESGISERQFLRRFKVAIGLSPKEYLGVRRMRWACAQAVLEDDGAGWAERAFDTGFADQAHLNREFRRVFGWTPNMTEEYLARIDHRRVKP